MHIYYAASPQPLLTQCVAPLLDDLHGDGLLADHFFINYWLEGPHVRLRLRPADPELEPEVRRRAEEAVTAFLRRRPALYNVQRGFLSELYNTLFDLELDDIERAEHIGPDGRMKVRPNNSFAYLPYEPGVRQVRRSGRRRARGVALPALQRPRARGDADPQRAPAHRHARRRRPADDGHGVHLHHRDGGAHGVPPSLPRVLAPYLRRHRPGGGATTTARYGEPTAGLPERFALVRDAVATGELDRLPQMLASWAEHSRELRDRDHVSGSRPGPRLPVRGTDTRDERVTDPVEAQTRLLSPYLHMTNNRLHITIRDEAYLSALLARSVRGVTPGGPRDGAVTAMATRDPTMQASAASRTQPPTQHGGDLMAARPRLRPDVVFGSVQHAAPSACTRCAWARRARPSRSAPRSAS